MDSVCFDEETYKSLLPVPKTHLFMKKITRIQAIDREMRKKWIKIKRDNQMSNLEINESHNYSPLKSKASIEKEKKSREKSTNFYRLRSLENELKRERIISNHRKNQEVFFRRKDHARNLGNLGFKVRNRNAESGSFMKTAVIEADFDSPHRRTQTEEAPPHEQSEQEAHSLISKSIQIDLKNRTKDYQLLRVRTKNKEQATTSNDSPHGRKVGAAKAGKTVPSEHRSAQNGKLSHSKSQIEQPLFLKKRRKCIDRSIGVINAQSEKELKHLLRKSDLHLTTWADNRKNLLNRLKGSHVYYQMSKPSSTDQYY